MARAPSPAREGAYAPRSGSIAPRRAKLLPRLAKFSINLCNLRNPWIFFADLHFVSRMNYSTRHLRFGWWALAIYVCLGIVLETMHGFKIGWYLDVGNEVRRLMFTLGHFHGTMLALVNIAAGLTIRSVEGFRIKRSVSWSLIGAAILLPGGFLLGGFVAYDGGSR